MKELEERILAEGIVRTGNVLKVGSFLNHQIDVQLVRHMAEEWKRLFEGEKVTKVLTIEASGIALASITAEVFGCPMLFAKKSESINLDGSNYSTRVHSYTHGRDYDVICTKAFLSAEDRVLLVDDFLAQGAALEGLMDLAAQAGAHLVGCGIAIEKSFQPGGDRIRAKGIRVESLARIASLEPGKIEFVAE